MENEQRQQTATGMIIFAGVNTTGNLFSMVLSLILYPVLYDDNAPWFTQHRISSAIGVAIIAILSIVNRHVLRIFANHNEGSQVALDTLAILSSIFSVASGTVQADIFRGNQK